LAAFFFILGTGVIIAPEVVNFFRDIEYVWSLQKSLYRVPISIILFVPAFYFAKESSRHRTNEVVNRRRQHILTTLDPYTKLMDPKRAGELKIHVAKTVFSDIKVNNKEDADYQSIVERVKGLLDKVK